MFRIKFFLDPINGIEKYLNRMSESGYRLKSINSCIYNFEKCADRFNYTSQFIGANASKENEDYIAMLGENEEYKIYRAPINQGNFNYGKMRFRPYTREKYKTSTYWGNFNKEILVVEYKDDKPMKLLTDNGDIAKEYKDIRNAYLQGLVGVLFLLLYSLYKIYFDGITLPYAILFAILMILTIVLSIVVFKAHKNFRKYLDDSMIIE